jgi:hypothetical protein
MNRRHFIGMAATGATGFVWPATARHPGFLPRPALATPRLLDVLRDEAIVRDLGRRYLERFPDEDGPHTLAEAILADTRTTDTMPFPAWIANRVQRDFAEGRTVTLNGWILSVTEARQCALYSLLNA